MPGSQRRLTGRHGYPFGNGMRGRGHWSRPQSRGACWSHRRSDSEKPVPVRTGTATNRPLVGQLLGLLILNAVRGLFDQAIRGKSCAVDGVHAQQTSLNKRRRKVRRFGGGRRHPAPAWPGPAPAGATSAFYLRSAVHHRRFAPQCAVTIRPPPY